MKKQFAVLAFCLTVTMTNNAYSMDGEDEGRVERHVVPRFQVSDLNPYNWSSEAQRKVAVGATLSVAVGLGIYQFLLDGYSTDMNTQMTNLPKECNASLSFKIECDHVREFCDLNPVSSPGRDQIQFILQEVFWNGTKVVCQYFSKTPSCDLSANYSYEKIYLENGSEYWKWTSIVGRRSPYRPQTCSEWGTIRLLCSYPYWGWGL